MKLLKTLLSRFVITSILILLQIFGIIFLFTKLSEYFIYVYATFIVLSYVILLLLFNKKTNPSLIIPWMIFILIAPIPGVVSFFLFANQFLPKRIAKKMKKIEKELEVYRHCENLNLPTDVQSQINYVVNTSNLTPTLNNEVNYFKSGEDMYASILKDLKEAKEFIFLEFFILYEGEMLSEIISILEDKVKEGIDVRVIYDDIGSIKHLPKNYNRFLEKKGIRCVKFYPFAPVVSSVHNNRNHRKAIIIDGIIAYTGGINISDEYINRTSPFGYWKDNGIRMIGDSVSNYTILFLTNWHCFSNTHEDYSKFFKKTQVSNNSLVFPFGDGPAPIYEEYIGKNAYLNVINKSNKYLYITTPYFIVDYEITNALKNAAKRGVDVRIVVPHIPDKKIVFWITRSNYHDLVKANVKFYEYTPGFIHSKCILSDDQIAIIGTINFDYRSLVHHFESACIMYNVDCYKDMLEDFNEILSVSYEITLEDAKKVNRGKRILVNIVQFFSSLL